MSVGTQQDALIDTLRALRAEEKALVAMVEKANMGANLALIREHRKRLAQIRQELDEKFPEALGARDRCQDVMDTLKPQTEALKGRFEDLRARVRLGQLDAAVAKAQSVELQRQYEAAFEQITQQQYRIATLQEFYPGLEAAAAARPKRPRQAPPPQPRAAVAQAAAALVPPGALPDDHVPDDHDDLLALDPPDGLEPPDDVMAPEDDGDLQISRAVFTDPRPRERRAHPRYPIALPVKYRTDAQSIVARCSDLSLGGMYIESHMTLQPGTRLGILFAADGFPVEAEALVRYATAGVGMGVKFTHLSDVDRAPVEAEIARKSRA